MRQEEPPLRARPLGPPQSAPVFNCIVYLAPRERGEGFAARCANLPEVMSLGASERETLQAMVAAFKQMVGGYLARGETIPFVAPGPKTPGESVRLIAVHL